MSYDPQKIHERRNFVRTIVGDWVNICHIIKFRVHPLSNHIFCLDKNGEQFDLTRRFKTIMEGEQVLDDFFESQQREIDSE